MRRLARTPETLLSQHQFTAPGSPRPDFRIASSAHFGGTQRRLGSRATDLSGKNASSWREHEAACRMRSAHVQAPLSPALRSDFSARMVRIASSPASRTVSSAEPALRRNHALGATSAQTQGRRLQRPNATSLLEVAPLQRLTRSTGCSRTIHLRMTKSLIGTTATEVR